MTLTQYGSHEFVHFEKMNPGCNQLIERTPKNEYEFFEKNLKLVSISKNQILFDTHQLSSHIYYPVGAIVSMIADLPSGCMVETHLLGRCSMVGTYGKGIPSFYQAKVRHSGLAYRMDTPLWQKAMTECPVYAQHSRDAIHRILMQLSMSVICSKKHSIDQQLIRWILLTLDNSLSSSIAITHQELSDLLGFRREAVSLTMNKFSDMGVIEKYRGEFNVVDRAKLEMASCDCYWIGSGKIRTNRPFGT